MKAISEEIYGK